MDREMLSLCCTLFSSILHFVLLIPPPLQQGDDDEEICGIAMTIIMALYQFMLLVMSINPPLLSQLTLRNRLFFHFHGHDYDGRDVFTMISQQRYLFWLNTGEQPQSVLQFVYQTVPHFFRITRCGNPRQRLPLYKLSICNGVLLVLMWLRKYLHIDTLALLFDISPPQIVSGFLGSTHDSTSYRLMVPVGPGLALDVPHGVFFMADKGYADVPPLLTPFRQVQIRRLGRRLRNKARKFNREHSRKRIKIEHVFKNVKDYKCTSGI